VSCCVVCAMWSLAPSDRRCRLDVPTALGLCSSVFFCVLLCLRREAASSSPDELLWGCCVLCCAVLCAALCHAVLCCAVCCRKHTRHSHSRSHVAVYRVNRTTTAHLSPPSSVSRSRTVCISVSVKNGPSVAPRRSVASPRSTQTVCDSVILRFCVWRPFLAAALAEIRRKSVGSGRSI
jgi:hypothetical protein